MPRNPRRDGFACFSMRRPFYLLSRSSISAGGSGPRRSRCESGGVRALIADSPRVDQFPAAETKARLSRPWRRLEETIRLIVSTLCWAKTLSGFTLGPRAVRPIPSGGRGGSLAAGEFEQSAGVVPAPDVARLPLATQETLLSFEFAPGPASCCSKRALIDASSGSTGFGGRGLYFPRSAVRLTGAMIANVLEREKHRGRKGQIDRRLERALRMQMVGQLASGVAHNFSNIIAAILGYSEMAGSEVEPGGRRHGALLSREGRGTGARPGQQHPDFRTQVGCPFVFRVGLPTAE